MDEDIKNLKKCPMCNRKVKSIDKIKIQEWYDWFSGRTKYLVDKIIK